MANKYADALYDAGYQLSSLNYKEMKLLARQIVALLDDNIEADLVAEILAEVSTELQAQEND